MKTNFWNIIAVLGLVLGIIGLNSNPAQADDDDDPADAVTQVCGNGVREGAEECDDGNTTANDGCSAVCRIEIIAPPSGPMKVERIEAGEIKTPVIKAGKVETPVIKADRLDVGVMSVAGSENFPLHQFGILANYATSFGSPYSLQLRVKYSAMWGVDNRGTLIGLAFEGGVGFWNWYTTEKSVQPMIPLSAAFQVGNTTGGLAVGPELWMLWPLDGHGSDEKSEIMTMIRVGGWINVPGRHGANAFVMQPWVGIPVYQPRNPSSPHFNNPAFLLGISLGWGHTFNPLPSEIK